ncbi:Threonine/homoserine/homoserine lactone efflux protein [Octadecabacter temperatus]|uniref:Cysteine/O-acetylserine efflux protein n=1 Tax=Octadecabacter temperatus TaxID=1458307 RepID=A0A0K0Y589_9RHOB|nr:LysE family translocator [Octadecabacter temperatus]AKS46110.1 Cysteine/O-acetylserine efflux protein [Octadecabacter temperatus]SIO07654.1 Threonine/homoserine/homoserine lactone efflux protein [Octadecabacter temperatus]
MSLAVLPFLTFATSQVGTPGPANMVLLATGARFGLRRALPFVAGVALGKQLIIWPLGFGLMAVQDDYPMLFEALKWVSIAYILWLAYRVANMRLKAGEAEGQPHGFFAGLIVHPLNPKAWAMITTGFTTFVSTGTPPLQATASIAICLLGLQMILHPIWTYAGQRIAVSLAGTPGEKYLMWTLAALTVASVVYALFAGGGQ